MVLRLILSFLLLCPAIGQAQDAMRYDDVFDTEYGRFTIPSELYLKPQTATSIEVKLAGNLYQVQRALPRILSEVIYDECERRLAVEMNEAVAEGDMVRMRGRMQIISYLCGPQQRKESRSVLFSNITAVDLLLSGGIRDHCLHAEIAELTLSPGGLTGGILNAFGLTERLTESVRGEINDVLNSERACIDLPEPLLALETRIDQGGFRDFGDGTMGFVIKGNVQTTPEHLIDLLEWMHREGVLEDTCDCESGN